MKDFIAAAGKSVVEVTDDDVIEFNHEDTPVRFYHPSTAQLSVLLGLASSRITARNGGTFMTLMFNLMDDDTRIYFESRLMDRHDAFDLDGENGLVDIFEHLAEEWSARPTKQPSDFQPPQRQTGKGSTATTRAKGSTSSSSRSRATSR